jgi:hypothetical protein
MESELAPTSNQDLLFASHKKVGTKLYLGLLWTISVMTFAAIQLWLGTDERILVLAFVSLLCCVTPLFLFGIDDIGAVFIFALLSKYSFFPLWIKTLMSERIDIGLTSPLRTFEMMLVGLVISCLALLLAKTIPVKRRLLDYRLNHQQMLLGGYLATIVGLFFLTLHVIFVPVILPSGEITRGFGGFGSLVGPLYFGISCLTVVSFRPNTNPLNKIFLLVVFIVLIVLSFQTNAKAEFTLAIFTFIATIFYFHIKIKARYIAYSLLFLAFYLIVFAPVIHLTRTDTFKTANFSGKISIIRNMISDKPILEMADQSNEIFNYNYYPTVHSFIVDRLEMIQDIDIVAGGISDGNTIKWLPVQWAIESALPRFIVRNKPSISDIDLIAYNAGYYPILVPLNHTIGVFGTAYAMFLWPGLIWISLLILFLYLFIQRLIVMPKLGYNLFGIFLLSKYVFVFSEQSVQALLTALLRSIPIDAILILAILILVVNVLHHSRKCI